MTEAEREEIYRREHSRQAKEVAKEIFAKYAAKAVAEGVAEHRWNESLSRDFQRAAEISEMAAKILIAELESE